MDCKATGALLCAGGIRERWKTATATASTGIPMLQVGAATDAGALYLDRRRSPGGKFPVQVTGILWGL